MRAGLKAVIDIGAAKGVTRVTAGNYGGKLGQHHYHLRELSDERSYLSPQVGSPAQRLDLSGLTPAKLANSPRRDRA